MNRTMFRGAVGVAIIAVIVLTLGLVLDNQANFSDRYVHDQLVEHKIRFTPATGLQGDQKNVPCLVKNAGKPLTTAKQAECYAKYQVGLDLLKIDNGRGYSETHYAAYLLKVKTAEALASRPEDPATAALVRQSDELSRRADDLLAGEAVKGLLLTAYGFGLLGERGGQAAIACFFIAGALLLASLATFAVGARSGRRGPVAGPTDRAGEPPEPRLRHDLLLR